MFTTNSKDLASAIDAVAQVVPAKSPLPIVQYVRLHQYGDLLRIYGTDLETSIVAPVDVEDTFGTPVNVALPPKLLLDVLKNITGTVSINIEPQNKVKLSTDSGVYHISGLNGDDYPLFPSFSSDAKTELSVTDIDLILNKVVPFASDDDMKPAMNGVYFDFDNSDSTLITVATDAHKLGKIQLSGVHVVPYSVIVPLKLLRTLPKLCKQAKSEVVVMSTNKTNVGFDLGSIVVVGRVIDARFPDYNNVIPKVSSNKMVVNRFELMSSLKRLMVFSNKITHLGRFKLTGNDLVIETMDTTGHEANEAVSCLYEGEEMEIGFNMSQLLTVLQAINTDDVVFELGSPGRAAVIMPSYQDEAYTQCSLLMPVMLSHGYY